MNLRQLKSLVNETVREEQTKSRNTRKKKAARKWQTIVENTTRAVLSEEADPSKIKLPTKLSDTVSEIGPEAAAEQVKAGLQDGAPPEDDVVTATKGSENASALKPSQSTMKVQKACQFAFSALMQVNPMFDGPGGDLGAIISSDNHIMDGHHRWMATLMTDPTATCQGPKLNLPGAQLIGVLNLVTVGVLGRTAGNEGEGAFADFVSSKMAPLVEDIIKNGYWGQPDAAACMQAATDFVGEEALADPTELSIQVADKFEENIKSSGENWKTVPDGAPAREDMPVINADEVQKAVDALASGEVDLAEPYATNESFDLNRWNKLAGILND